MIQATEIPAETANTPIIDRGGAWGGAFLEFIFWLPMMIVSPCLPYLLLISRYLIGR